MKPQIGRGESYFAVNDKTFGVRTSYRVSGRLGELGRRFALFADAWEECKRLNRAYELGLRDGAQTKELETAGERA